MGKDDIEYLQEDMEDDNTLKTMKDFTEMELIGIADGLSDNLWNSSYGDGYNDDLEVGLEQVEEEREKEKIEKAKKKDLPLLMDCIHYDRNKEYLEKRLKS